MSDESTALLQEYCPEVAAGQGPKSLAAPRVSPPRVDVQVLPPKIPWWVRILQTSVLALRARWFWYAIASSLCWTAWAFTARVGAKQIAPAGMQFVSAFGFLLVGVVLVITKQFQWVASVRGIGNALASGVLLGVGGLALYGAYRSEQNASVITGVTSLYPVVTVALARMFLREKLNTRQVLGVCSALLAILILSS
jgi:transporter family protein